ncbi:hypothetical protein D3C76_1275690 [compost metagenome]
MNLTFWIKQFRVFLQEARMRQTTTCMLCFWPRVTEVQINALQFFRFKNFFDLFNIRQRKFQVRRCLHISLTPRITSFLTGTTHQFIIHINTDEIKFRIFITHLADKLAFTHTKFHEDRVIIAKQFRPFSFMLLRVQYNKINLLLQIFSYPFSAT